jgi:diguanylate cyclase (GGDEF)-like protein
MHEVRMDTGVSVTGDADAGRTGEIERALDQLLSTTAGCLIRDQLSHLVAEWTDLEAQIGVSYQKLLRQLVEEVGRDPSDAQVAALCAAFIRTRHAAAVAGNSVSHGAAPGPLAGRLSSDAQLQAALARLPERLATISGVAMTPAITTPPGQAPGEAGRASHSGPEQRVHTAYRQHLDRQRNEINKLQTTLAQKVHEAIVQNKEFGDLLRIERNALQQAENVTEVATLRRILLGGVDELLHGQQALAENLAGTGEVLQLIESDSARLQDELQKVRLLSMTDEFTGLPNRRAFLRRLDDELRRAQRYDTPLTLAILDLDEFKAVNDNHGHLAGDRILRCYATQVLSIFRHHDMVARYGGEEFSVLFPNTVLEGAQAALHKVRHKAGDSHCEHDGAVLPLPTFSAGITLYRPGESPTALIARADRALYRAKHLGRNRVEIEVADGPRPNPADPAQGAVNPAE